MKPTDRWVGGAYRNAGAARVSLFFALWTGALLVVQEMRVEASPVPQQVASSPAVAWWVTPTAPPTIESREFWQGISAHSDVMSGTWTRDDEVPARPATPVAHDATVDEQPAIKTAPPVATVSVKAPVVLETVAPTRMERTVRADSAAQAKVAARTAIAAGDDEAAYRVLKNEATRAEPDREHYDLLAAVMVRTGRFEEAVDVYAALLSSDAGNPRLWAGYALALERIGRAEPAQLAYKNLLRTAAAGSALRDFAQMRLHQIG